MGSAGEEAGEEAPAAEWWAARGAGSTAGPVGTTAVMEGEEGAVVAAAVKVVVVFEAGAAASAPIEEAEVAAETGAVGHYER